MPLITFPLLNSENFYEVGILPTNEFHTKHFLSDWWIDTIYDWQKYNRFGGVKPSQFYVLKQLDQIVTIQFNVPTTGVASFVLKMMSCDGTEYPVSPATYMTQATIAGNVYDNSGRIPPIPLKTIQYKFLLSDILSTNEGIYYFIITVDDGVITQYISEPTDIKATHENTILVNYSHSVNDYDVISSLNPSFSVRWDATLSEPSNEFNPTTFRNQKGDLRQVRARNWRKYILTIGASEGANGIIVDKVSNIMKCDNIIIDGKKMLLSEGSDIEAVPFSQNYPLSTIKLELEEYYNSDSVVWGDASLVYIMDLGSFPYVIPDFVMADDFGSYSMLSSFVTSIAEAHDTTMEDAIIAEFSVNITAAGKTGTFKKESGALYYERGAGETLYRASFAKLDTCLKISFTTVTSFRDFVIAYEQTGYNVISAWEDSLVSPTNDIPPIKNIGNGSYTVTLGSNGDFIAYFYTDNKCTKMEVYGDIGAKIITSLDGKCSQIMNTFIFRGGTMPSLDLSFLFNSAKKMAVLNWQYSTIDSVDTSGFAVTETGMWRYFNFIYLLNNSLDPTALDEVLNDYQEKILYTYFGTEPVGVIDLRNQSPTATRTAASDLAVTNLTSTGYTILP